MDTTLIAIALVIVLALAGYAGWLLWKLRKQRLFQEGQQEKYLHKKREHEDYLIDSIKRIADSMAQEDLNISEGVIRLKHLLDTLGLPDEERAKFNALDELYEKVRDFETHEARSELPPRERYRQDREREAHEDDHRVAVLRVARQLAAYEFKGVGTR